MRVQTQLALRLTLVVLILWAIVWGVLAGVSSAYLQRALDQLHLVEAEALAGKASLMLTHALEELDGFAAVSAAGTLDPGQLQKVLREVDRDKLLASVSVYGPLGELLATTGEQQFILQTGVLSPGKGVLQAWRVGLVEADGHPMLLLTRGFAREARASRSEP